jgi:large subunit ribosomal protein L5e
VHACSAQCSLFAEGKTDYAARRSLIIQDKNKYASPKYRLVVRLTNRYVVVQVVYATVQGDRMMAAANSAELVDHGLKVGLKNYTAAYVTGLLCARRLLKKLGMEANYKGQEEADGKVNKTTTESEFGKAKTFYVSEVAEERKPFRCYLDVGIRATTTGSRVFGALKGASDGGLDIPHNEKRFPGYMREAKKFDPEDMKARITGEHVASYISFLKEEDTEAYDKIFAKYIEAGIDEDNYQEIVTAACESIRTNPDAKKKAAYKPEKKYQKPAKLNNAQRKENVAAKKSKRAAQLKAAMGGAADDE